MSSQQEMLNQRQLSTMQRSQQKTTEKQGIILELRLQLSRNGLRTIRNRSTSLRMLMTLDYRTTLHMQFEEKQSPIQN